MLPMLHEKINSELYWLLVLYIVKCLERTYLWAATIFFVHMTIFSSVHTALVCKPLILLFWNGFNSFSSFVIGIKIDDETSFNDKAHLTQSDTMSNNLNQYQYPWIIKSEVDVNDIVYTVILLKLFLSPLWKEEEH